MSHATAYDISDDDQVASARERFREALLRSKRSRSSIGEVEVAAGKFCQALRRIGHTPERALIDAKRVIDDTIDGDAVGVAERAVASCIRYYFQQ
ncbi:MAG: hypothetical protein ABJE10_02895 [bacterium]